MGYEDMRSGDVSYTFQNKFLRVFHLRNSIKRGCWAAVRGCPGYEGTRVLYKGTRVLVSGV